MKLNDALHTLGIDSSVGHVGIAEVKDAFRRAALKWHPDRNPAGLEMMKVVNDAWATCKKWIEEKESVRNTDTSESGIQYPDQLNEALNVAINCAGLEIEICGNWAWVGGDTRTHKSTLKAAGYRWAHKKAKWYYRPAEWKSASRGQWSMDQIRDFHGSERVATRSRPGIEDNAAA